MPPTNSDTHSFCAGGFGHVMRSSFPIAQCHRRTLHPFWSKACDGREILYTAVTLRVKTNWAGRLRRFVDVKPLTDDQGFYALRRYTPRAELRRAFGRWLRHYHRTRSARAHPAPGVPDVRRVRTG